MMDQKDLFDTVQEMVEEHATEETLFDILYFCFNLLREDNLDAAETALEILECALDEVEDQEIIELSWDHRK